MIFLGMTAGVGVSQQTQGPLSKNQVMALVKAGMETPELVELIHEHGIDFDLTDDYLQAVNIPRQSRGPGVSTFFRRWRRG